MKSYFGLVGAFLFALTAEAAVPTLSSPANDACLATLKGSTTEEGSQKWFFYGLNAADRKSLMNFELYGPYAQNSTKYNNLRAKMGNTYGDHPKATTFSWSGTGPFTLTIKRRDGSVFLEKSGIAGTALSVDNFEIAASYMWTVSNADGTSTPRAFTTEDTVPRLLNGGRADFDYVVEGYGGTSVTTWAPHGVRDMGGYIGKDGRRARQGLVVRNSAFESDWKDDQHATLYVNDTNRSFWKDFLGIKTEIDLRENTTETKLTKSTLGTDVKYVCVPTIPGSKNLMEQSESDFKKGVKQVFQLFADSSNYPISFHCTHGKDRTGVIGFLLGCVLDYSLDDIYADYEATIFWQPKQGVSVADANGLVGYLNDYWSGSTVQEKAVTFIKSCGIDDTQLNAIREIMLEPIEEDEPDEPPPVPVGERKWEGKRISILGDSYSTFAGVSGDPANDSLPAGDTAGGRDFENNAFYPGDVSIGEAWTWWRQVLASLGGTLDKNNSVGGSEITRDVGSSAGIAADGRNLIRSFVNRAANGGLGNPDVILVLGGTNDGWHGLDPSSFKAGVATLFAALKSGYPNAQVIVLVPAQVNDSTGIAGIGADLRTVLLNGAAGSGFLSVDLNGVGFAPDDFRYGHPKASGMTKIANAVVNAVNAAPTFYKTLQTDGRGYILTDYQPKTSRSRIEYDLRFLYLGLSVGLGIANGTSSSGAANDKEWGGYFNGENRTFTYYTEPGGACMSFGAGFCDTSVRHTISMGQGAVALDDQVTAIPTPADDYTTGGKFALFAVNYGGASFASRANVRVAGIRVFEGDTVVRSWVPTKDVNGTATLYDLVNRKFETVKAGVFSVDDTVDPTWEAQAANSWTVQPSVSSPVMAGTLPTISLGTAKCGNCTQTATYTAKDIQNLPAGTYTQVVEVKATADYQGLRQELTFTVTGTVPTAASVAPTAVAPLGGASVATHTAKQKEFIGLPAAQRKRVLAILYERERAEYAANDGHPQPVRLQWNGGDGQCTVRVYRGKETTPVQTHVVVTRWTNGNFLDVDNLEVGRAYRWTVTNGKGTAEGSFVTEGETPRLLNAGVVGNTRDLGGYVGLDGRRVRQGMFLRSRCFDTNKRATYGSILTAAEEAFFRDFIGLKTEIDLRGDTWITQSFVPGVTTRVNTAWPLDYTGAYMTDATKRTAMKAALAPIFDAAKYPIDVHCHSGQDRTGMYCFILEALLGVSEADCIRDWEWSALGNSGFNAGDTYQLDSFLSKFRALNGATTQAKAETFMKWVGYSSTQIEAFREIMLEPAEEPVEPPHEHAVENVPAVAATYATPGRTAGTRCSDCGEILSGCEVVPVLSSAITLSATVAADGLATVALGNVQAPVVLSVVYGNEDRGGEYYRDADWDGGETPIGWDAWQIVGYIPAGSTSATYTIPNWGVDAADGRNGAKFARFILTAAEQTLKCAYATATGTNPATQFIDTGIVPTGETTLNLAVTLGVDPASKVLADTPSSRDGALTYGLSFDASKHPTFNYAGASYTVSTVVSTGNTVDFRANQVVSGKTGWKCKVNDSSKYATSQPSAKSTLTTDGTLHVYGLGTFGTFSIGGSTDAYFVPAVGFDVNGNELAGFFETKSGRMFASEGGAAFTLNEPSANYRKDLMSNIPLCGETATIEYTAAPPSEPVVEPEVPDGVDVYDYLQTDGTGYILTDYTPNLKKTMIEFKLKLLDATVSHGLYVANACTKGDASCTSQMILLLQPSDGTVRYFNQATSDDKRAKLSDVAFDATEEHVVRTFGDTVWYDDRTALVEVYVETDAKVGGPLQLLAENFSEPRPVCQTYARVEYVKAWEIDGAVTNLVRKWVPAKTANGVATLYEVVNGKYETVSGAGAAFEVGMNGPARAVNAWTVSPSFEPLEYAAGTAPTFVIGESLYGTPVATYPAARLAKLDGGTYVQKVVVPATGEYTGLSTSFTFTVTGELPRTPTVAPGALAPNGVTVALHTDRQKAFLSLPRDERRALYLDTLLRAQLAADGGEPKPVTLRWTGDGECTVTVVRAKDQKVVFATTLVDDTVDVWNLEINTAYTWSVVNALGTAKGTFRTEDEAPRLLRDPAPSADGAIRGIRDLGGRVGLDGLRVRQGRAFRCSQLNKEVPFVTDENRRFYLDELGIKTDLDFRSGKELYGITSSPLGPSVAFVNAQIGSYTGLFDSTTAFKKTFDTFLDEANYPIVFHCAAGQDRTGVVAFLLNALLGVETEELDKDWETTAFWNGSVDFCHANLDKFYETLATKANGGETVQEQAVNAVLNMGYTMADVEKFRSLMLEPAEEPGAMPAALVISEVCARCQPKAVPACKDLGWIEFYNGSNETVNLRDYKLLVLNRGKKIDAAKNILPLADCEIAPGGYALVYTSESFGNAAVAEVEDTFAGRGTITVYPKKINQKKYPFVQLFRGNELVQTVVVPVDLADEKSYTTVPERKILATPTPGAANWTEGVAYGPNVSSLYGVKDAPDPWRAFPKAQVGEDYEVCFPVNPADMSTDAEDEIICVRLLYRIGFGETVEGPVMTKAAAADAMNGWVYTGTIPGAAFAKAGELVRFAALITDGMGRTWRSPSFCNPDDGYEWYGTIVAPGTAAGEGTESANLQTFHLFADPDEVADTPGEMNTTALMNLDADNPNFVTEEHPYGARVGVYDSTTGLYYDHVRIDLRGHTSAGFVKKSHGLRFNKSQPLSCTDPVTGTVVEEIRKSSFVSEYPDVSGVRQMLAFKIFNENGSPAPFHYPVRLNLNGRFYQLAYHSERFTDELIEDCYGFDPLGYSYKNVGTFADGNVLKIEKKTPDDDHEDDLAVLKAFEATLQPANSRTVVKSFDLPAWINYVALERITGERDGLCANTSAFYDINGTDTWRPLAYDMNMSFGVYNTGIWQDDPAMKDWSKARGLDPTAEHLHPFAGGLKIGDDGNLAVENVFQSAKFRRLYLRRLRTLMDKVLKAPDTALADTPAFQWAKGVADRIADDAALDRALWMDTADKIATGSANWVWGDRHTEAWTVAEGWTDLWDNYVVPRRDYLFNEQTATPAGYAANLPAGIPAAQKPTAALKAGFAFASADVGTTLVISNGNAEAVDMSGWTLTGKVTWTIPAGTVIDANDVLTVVADRRAYVAAHEAELGEQVIVGNAAFDPSAASLVLADDAGSEVVEVGVPPTLDVGEATATPGTDFVGATVVLALGADFDAHGNPVAAKLAVGGASVAGAVDLDAKTVTFEVESAAKGETYAGEVTLTVGDERLKRSVTLEQGRRAVIDASDGWIRVGETEVFDSQLVTPENPAPETAVVTLKARLELGAGADEGAFDAADQVGVIAVETQEGNAYLFKTAEGVVTNVSASLELGAETEVEILADYAKRTVRYVVGGETNGPYALPVGALQASAVNLGGSGVVKYVNGDYAVMGLNTNLAASGGAEYATVAAAVAAGGPVALLWDASWTPTACGAYSFVTNGHELKIGGDLAFEVKKNDDGTLSVSVTGTVEEPKPATIELRDGKVVIGVANPDSKRSYALARVEKLGEGEFVPDESTWKTGAELLSGASLEVSVTPGATSEFFKVVVK